MPLYIYARNYVASDGTSVLRVSSGDIPRSQYGRLTPAEYAALSGAYVLTPVTSEIQLVTLTGAPSGGTFALSFNNQLTTSLPYNATAQQVQNALVALSSVGPFGMDVSGNAGGPYTCQFDGAIGAAPQGLIVAQSSIVGGGISVTRLQAGVVPSAKASTIKAPSTQYVTLTGNPADDAFAIGAGTGAPITGGGSVGPQGPTGAQGPPGAPGIAAVQPTAPDTSTWVANMLWYDTSTES